MSETDSENDYESADDSEELTRSTSSVPNIEAVITASELKPCESENPESGDSPQNVLDKTEKAEAKKENISSDKNVSNTENVFDAPSGDSKTVDGNSDLASQLQTLLVSDKPLEVVEKNSSEKKQRSDSVESQSKRVTLRLEKKIQQKSQSISKADSVEEPPPKPQEKSTTSWGFGSWGSSLLSSAASSVTTFTSQVSQGIGTVLETVESSLGAPPPEDLATILRERKDSESPVENAKESAKLDESRDRTEKDKEVGDDRDDIPATSSLFTGVSSLKSVIENTGTKVLMGGLDTLELIGKKTIDMLTEGDPGLRKTRSALSQKINLSELLREAKDKAEQEQANASDGGQEDAFHFTSFFDEFQGLVHLEALEMLSSQCQSKVQSALLKLSGEDDLKEELDHVKRICQDLPSADDTPDDKTQDFEECLAEHLKNLQLNVDLAKIKQTCKTIHSWLDNCIAEQDSGQVKDAKDLCNHAIRSLAEFTARSVEQFHKFGELLLVQADPDFNVLICATHLTGLTSVLCLEVSIISTKFCQCLNTAADDSEDPDAVTPLITNVFLEASNSTTYIQDAFQLLVPVLQTILLR